MKEHLFCKHKLCERKLVRATVGYVLLPKLLKSKQHRAGTYVLVFPSALLRKTLLLRRPLFSLLLPLQLCFHFFLKVFHAAKKSLEMKTLLKIKRRKKAARLRGLQLFERKARCKLISNTPYLSFSTGPHTVTPSWHVILGH